MDHHGPRPRRGDLARADPGLAAAIAVGKKGYAAVFTNRGVVRISPRSRRHVYEHSPTEACSCALLGETSDELIG
jgi:hypothetical protein